MSKAIRNLRGVGKLSEENMADALKEVRTALLSADVHFKVARDFVEQVKIKAIGQEVLKSISPGQQIVKIINDELAQLLGEGDAHDLQKRPLKVMLVGLHGSGKTTSTVKLARLLRKKGYRPSMVACDVYRPAAIDQLETLGASEDIPVFSDRTSKDVPAIGKRGLHWALEEKKADLILFDTAGRLQVDENLIDEIKRLRDTIRPDEVFLVADSALGQEAVNVARHFHEAVTLTGIILTKLDGDSRGGAALSMKAVTGVPIRFIGHGEKPGDFDTFFPERMAQRIIGMGDVVSLVEKAQETIDQGEAERLAERMQRAEFNFDDFLSQLQQIKKMGPLSGIIGMLPGASNLKVGDREENMMKRSEAIIQSMTRKERLSPQIMNASRRLRIAKGSGLEVRDVNQLIKQYSQMKKMMKSMRGSKGKKMMKKLGAMGGQNGGGMRPPGF